MASPPLSSDQDGLSDAAKRSAAALGELTVRYPIVRELQGGGSGARLFVVRRAGDGAQELLVAKFFEHAGASRDRSEREKRAVDLLLAAGNATGLVVESYSSDQCYWYVMPYFDGETLHDRVIREREGDGSSDAEAYWELALRWLASLIGQVATLHEFGLVHKDIKPGNVMVDGDTVKVIDIGLLTAAESQALLTVGGTERYRDSHIDSLEARSMKVSETNPKSFDVYSMGAVLYFVFEGDHPPEGRLSLFGPTTPVAVQHVARQAMARSAQRYPSARAMLADIEFLLEAAGRGKLAGVRMVELPSFCAARGDTPEAGSVATPGPSLCDEH